MSENVEKVKLTKGQKIAELREHHLPVFEAMGVTQSAFYSPKMFYTPSGESELYVSFFISEMQRNKDIYTEMVDREYNSEDNTRTLYKWEYNSYWESCYDKTPLEPVRVLIPVRDLKIIRLKDVLLSTKEELMDGCSEDDCDLQSMTIRDLAAILLRKPVSNKAWLNDLIADSKPDF
jgi:hypothetical protein